MAGTQFSDSNYQILASTPNSVDSPIADYAFDRWIVLRVLVSELPLNFCAWCIVLLL